MTFLGDSAIINDPGRVFILCLYGGRYVFVGGGKVLRKI
jgi:hypothetical protein